MSNTWYLERKKKEKNFCHSLTTKDKRDETDINVNVYIIVEMGTIKVLLPKLEDTLLFFYNPKSLIFMAGKWSKLRLERMSVQMSKKL